MGRSAGRRPRHGFRNAQATVLAPTGTISFLMDCDTTGIEPDIALVKYKQLAGGGMLKIVNNTVPPALKTLGYDQPTIEGDPGLHRQARHDRRRAGPEAGAPAGVRLCVQAAQRHAVDRLAGPRADDGRGPAVPLRRDLARRSTCRARRRPRHRRRLHRRLAAGPEGPGHLSRRLEGEPAAQHQQRGRQGGRQAEGGRQAAPRAAARHAATRSRTSSASAGTRATSPSACTKTAARASCSSPWPRKAAPSAG